MTLTGEVTIERSLYQTERNGASYCPLVRYLTSEQNEITSVPLDGIKFIQNIFDILIEPY